MTKIWDDYSDYQKALWHYTGFYEFERELWVELIPYVFMFFFAIIVSSRFAQKLKYEDKELSRPTQNLDDSGFLSVPGEIDTQLDAQIEIIPIKK